MSGTRRRVLWAQWWVIGVIALGAFNGPGEVLAGPDGGGSTPEGMLDLTGAVVVVPPGLSGPEKVAVTLLVEEVEKRTLKRWPVADRWPAEHKAVVAVGPASALDSFAGRFAASLSAGRAPEGAEGFRIRSDGEGPAVLVVGNDDRGVLFGVGRLLRELRMTRGRVLLPQGFATSTAPRHALRGHQLGYRPKTNSYDAWDLPQWEQYIRDLAIFGTNAVELIPPISDDESDSPHFPRPPDETMVGMAKVLDHYGLNVWLWLTALRHDYTDPKAVEHELESWGEVFKQLPRLDQVFVPGGDPGHTQPKVLMALLEKATEVLHRYHPKAKIWVSPQGFTKPWLDEFLEIVAREPDWLGGVVFAPHMRLNLADLRRLVPQKYPIRQYPDITHTRESQYPVLSWDRAWAETEGREPINPRPRDEAAIVRFNLGYSVGFLTYSEGCNDDVNKFVWNGLGWDPGADVVEVLRQYARTFIGPDYADDLAQALLGLERNWKGSPLVNGSIETTLQQFQDMERSASPQVRQNWRFQQPLYRAYYDAYIKDRLAYEKGLEASARQELRRADQVGALAALDRAEAILDRALTHRVAADRRARIFELAEALFQSIHMQLSVPRYRAIGIGRGANLDAIDVPLNDRPWLLGQFAAVRQLATEPERLRAIDAILNRTDPGPGGFYDDLGDLDRQPHLVRQEGPELNPASRTSMIGYGTRPGWPIAWSQNAQSLYDNPLQVRYADLDPHAHYRVKVVYAGDRFDTRVRLDAEGREVHPLMKKPEPVRPVEFDVPAAATADGTLTLTWHQEPGRGANGRGCQVAEVWLIKK